VHGEVLAQLLVAAYHIDQHADPCAGVDVACQNAGTTTQCKTGYRCASSFCVPD
jgi:hypothetical protein